MHAASQPPQPHAEGPQSAVMHRLGMLELLMSYSATTAGAALHALGQPTGHADDASSQCCEDRPRRGAKRSADSSCDDSGMPGGAKRARRKYAYIEVHISNSANAPKPAAHPGVSMSLNMSSCRFRVPCNCLNAVPAMHRRCPNDCQKSQQIAYAHPMVAGSIRNFRFPSVSNSQAMSSP